MYTSDIDYPACHSMDTDWFAIDKAGNVALMNSSEDGAVALTCDTQMGFDDFIEANGEKIAKNFYRFSIAKEAVAHIESLLQPMRADEDDDALKYFEGFVKISPNVNVQDLALMQSLQEYSLVVQISDDILFLYSIDYGIIDDVATDKISGAYYSSDCFSDEDVEENYEYLLGFYRYESDFDGIYEKKSTPKYPLIKNDLRGNKNLSEIDAIRFAETKEFNPAQYVACKGWGI